MDPDATLAWILRLAAAIDLALDADREPAPDDVYTLVGLVAELDAHLAAGGRAPSRWRRATVAPTLERAAALTLDATLGASNDVTTAQPPRRRPRVRRSAAAAQLVLPFVATAG